MFSGNLFQCISVLICAGKYILSGSLDSTLRLWNFVKGRAVKRYKVRHAADAAIRFF